MNRLLAVCLFSVFVVTRPDRCLAIQLPSDPDTSPASNSHSSVPIASKATNKHTRSHSRLAPGTSASTELAAIPASTVLPPGDNTKATPKDPARDAPSSDPLAIVKTTIQVVAVRHPIETTEGFERSVTEREIETSAGTFGDPSRFIQLLPGVISDNDQYNDFIVRGGVPAENLFIVDNIEVPSINHLALSDTTGGFVSMIDNAAIQKLTMHTDAYDSKYEQRLSSIVEISTRPEGRISSHSESELGIAGVGGSTSRPWGNDGSIFVSTRRSILNLLTNDIGMNGVPIYTNGFVRAERHVGERDSWWGLSLTGIDSIAIRPSATDYFETNPYDIDYKGWRNTTGINWQHIYSPNAYAVLSLSNSEQSQSIVDNAQLLDNATVYSEKTRDGVTTAKYDGAYQKSTTLAISAGARLQVNRLDYNLDQPLGLQNPYSENIAALDAMSLKRHFATASSAAYAQTEIVLPRGIKVVLGERFAQWAMVGSEVWTPKLLLMIPVSRHTIHLGYAEYAQLPPSLYLLSFQNRATLTPIRSRQLTAGIDLVQSRALHLSAEVYQKKYEDYPVAQGYPQLSLGNVADTFGQAFLMFPMTNKGRGLARGIELSIEWRPSSRFTLTSALTYSRSWYAGLDGVLRRGNYDLPFVANVAGIFHLTKSSTLSFRHSEASGRPYTPDNLALSIAQNRDVYDLTRINANRGPAYHRLDFRLEKNYRLPHGVLTWHVGLENALGTKNFYSYAWRPRVPSAGVLAQEQMPRFPDGGIKYSF